jgi:hypothetical protein
MKEAIDVALNQQKSIQRPVSAAVYLNYRTGQITCSL